MGNRKNQIALELLLETNADLRGYKRELDRLSKILKDSNRKNAAASKKLTEKEYKKILGIKESLDKKYFRKLEKVERNYHKNIGKAAVKEQDKRRKSYVGKWKQAFGTVTRYASAGALLFKGIELGKAIFTEILELELAIDRVGVITGKTSAEVGVLTDTIYGLGVGFGIATKDATQFTIEMAKLGKSTEQIQALAQQAGGLSIILGEDLATAGKLMVTTMNQFGLSTNEADRVATTFFNTIRTSPIGVKDLQTAMQYVGSAAYAAGIEIEEVGNMIGRLSELGLRASKIGTGMRNVILKLSSDSRGFAGAMEDMAERGVSLAEAVELFGKRGALAGYNLINSWEEIRDEIENKPIVPDSNFMWESIRTTTNLTTEMARAYAKFKALVTGQKFEDPFGDLRETSRAFKAAGIEITDFPAKVIEARAVLKEEGKEVTNSAILEQILTPEQMKKFKRDYTTQTGEAKGVIQEGFDSFFDLGTDEANKVLAAKFEEVLKGVDDITTKVDAKSFITNQIESYKNQYKIATEDLAALVVAGDITNEEAVKLTKKNGEDLAGFLKTLSLKDKNDTEIEAMYRRQLLSVEVREDLVEKTIAKNQSLLLGVKKNHDYEEAIAAYNKIQEERKALIEGIKSGDVLETEAALESKLLDARESPLCAYFKIAGVDICNPEKQKKEFEDFKKDLNHFFSIRSSEVDRLISEMKADDQSLSSIKSNELQDLMTFAKFHEANAELSKKEAYDAWKKYTKDYLNGVRTAIDGEYYAQLSDIQNSRELIQGNLMEQMANTGEAINLAEAAGDTEQAEELKRMYVKYYQSFLDAEQDAKNEVVELGIKQENAQQDVDTKENKLASFVPEKSELEDNIAKYANYLNEALDTYRQFADEMDAQKQAAWDRDKENISNRAAFEKDQLRLAAEKNLLTTEQYNHRAMILEKKKIRDTNAIAKKQFEAKKKADQRNAILEGLAKAAQAFATTVGQLGLPAGLPAGIAAAAAVAAQTAIAVSAISQREYSPLKFALGGKVEGKSHAQGGVPFTVAGHGGYEMEGGEYVIKKSSVNANTLPLLDAINNDTRYNPTHFANGGQVETPNIEANKPTVVRAFITEKDLDSYERNRTVRNKNKSLF